MANAREIKTRLRLLPAATGDASPNNPLSNKPPIFFDAKNRDRMRMRD
ncbi:MAG: hypothetical protein AVDCRST_MAG74-317 [uncultured Pyrinomonadaceae bacterium]|jgi:hypothetical protein|uniref:Uncharacterized protein n=1 Tax=uncultured Pyrinomonadaceae bacterium TaxID=2283094 RepID=A0A6J4N7C3_9BACT|nr:MAG: hypothetical protein AVDCRST_MAG74-317 [uncultured Pyrinomonadaceae bacterium]